MLDFTNNRLTPPLYEQIKCSCLYNKINKFKLYVKKKNSITYFAMKWLRYFWRRGGGGGLKKRSNKQMGLSLIFFTTTNVRVANFPFVNGRFHFIDTQTILTCCCAILLKIKKIANGIVNLCLLDLMQCRPIPVEKKTKNQKRNL